jgi:ankyrin repeat protein
VEAASENPVEALIAALKANDASLVREVFARHPALKSRIDEPLPDYGFEAPALVAATYHHNSREIVDALLDAGANIDARSRWWAGSFGVLDSSGPELAEYLIARGTTVDIHAAARLGMIERVRELLAQDPQLVHARGGDGQLPLHFAATIPIAELLLDHGTDINARDIDHESTAAQYMVCQRQYMEWREPYRHDIAGFLISRGAKADILAASAVGDLALVERLLNDNPESIATTVSERWFPKHDPKSGGCIYIFGFGHIASPHMLAHQFGHTAVFDVLIERSAPWLALSQAAETGNEALVRQIAQQHPSIIPDLTPEAARRIVGAAFRNDTRTVELLLAHGWPSDAALENNQTALHYAAWHGNLAMARVLLEHGAPLKVFENEHGGSPLAWALYGSLHGWNRAQGDYAGVAQALLAAGSAIPKPERPLEAAPEVMEVVRRYLP